MNYNNTECYNKCYSTYAWEEKASWKPVKDNRILALYREVIAEARRKGFLHYCAETPPLRISSKLRRAIAFCYQHRVDSKSSRACIVLSDALPYQNDDFVRSTLVHELAHAICPLEEKHGQRWYHAACEIGKRWNYLPSRFKSNCKDFSETLKKLHPKAVIKYKYQLVCPKCGREFTRYKSMCASLKRPRYACGVCHTTLWRKDLASGEICKI